MAVTLTKQRSTAPAAPSAKAAPQTISATPAASQSASPPAADTGLTQSVDRALSILSLFGDEHPTLRVSDVSQALGLGPSTASRLLSTLEALNYVAKDARTGHYRLGVEVLRLGGVVLNENELRRQALGDLHDVSARTGLGANLSILHQPSGAASATILYLAHFDGAKAPRTYTLVGRRNPVHATGMGKVLLAYRSPEERRAMLDVLPLPLPAYTPNTVTRRETLEEELDRVIRRGYATEMEELAFGRACVAAPIRDRTGQVVAAMSVSGPLSAIDLPAREAELAGLTIECADSISGHLGYCSAPIAWLAAG